MANLIAMILLVSCMSAFNHLSVSFAKFYAESTPKIDNKNSALSGLLNMPRLAARMKEKKAFTASRCHQNTIYTGNSTGWKSWLKQVLFSHILDSLRDWTQTIQIYRKYFFFLKTSLLVTGTSQMSKGFQHQGVSPTKISSSTVLLSALQIAIED